MSSKQIILNKLDIKTIQAKLQAQEFSALDLSNAYLQQIENSPLAQKLITVLDRTKIQNNALAADQRLAAGEDSLLLGVPFLVTGNFLVQGQRVEVGSHSLANYQAPYNAEVIEVLQKAGAILLGIIKINDFKVNLNDNVVALLNNFSSFILSSNQPDFRYESFHDKQIINDSEPKIFNLKLSYGRSSRFGIISPRPSSDSLNIMTSNLSDVQTILTELDIATIFQESYNSFDATLSTKTEMEKLRTQYKHSALLKTNPTMIKIATYQAGLANYLHKKEFSKTTTELMVSKIKTEIYAHLRNIDEIISSIELSSNLARIDGLAWGMTADNLDEADSLADVYKLNRSVGFSYPVKQKILLAQSLLSGDNLRTYYQTALKSRMVAQDYVGQLFSSIDALISLNSTIKQIEEQDYLLYLASLTALPSLTMLTKDYQLNLVTNRFFDQELLNLANLINYQIC